MKTPKLVESSLGVRTTEDMARRIDVALKSVPKREEFSFRRKAASDTEVNPATRTDVSTITTAAMDRDREIVLPAGFDLDEYRANPIVLWGHNLEVPPIGKCLWVKATEDRLIAKTFYPERPEKLQGEWLPDTVFGLIAAGVLNAKSVGFQPLEIRDPTPEELQLHPEVERVITRALLVEYSVVNVPANPQALVEAVGKGLSLDLWNYKVVGRVKAKRAVQRDLSGPLADKLRGVTLDADKIAEEVIQSILKKWEV